ncbi:MAG: hypothetical protein WD185_09880 [Sneathiella sp.]
MGNKISTVIKFDGPLLENHTMDVAHLAPALIALSDVIKETNRKFNGERSDVKLLVNANLEQHCFELSLQLAQTIWDQVGVLLDHDGIASAQDIAEWIGIISPSASEGLISLFGLIKLLKGKKIKSTTVIKNESGDRVVQISLEGDKNYIQVNQQVFNIYTDTSTLNKAVAVLQPLRSDGYESLEFYDGDKIFEKFTQDDVPVANSNELPEIRPTNENVSKIRTEVHIRKAAYEGRSKWTLVYLKAIEASIDDIEWLDKFQSNEISVPPNSILDVELEKTVLVNEGGFAIDDGSYRVLKVYDVKSPHKQIDIFD